MSSFGINFSGLASGIDSNAIINALVAVERRPIQLLEQRKSTIKSQKNLFGDLKTKLEKLQEAAESLKGVKDFLEFSANTDKDKFFKATASTKASNGTYDIAVKTLAKAQINESNGKLDKDVTTYTSTNQVLTFTMDPDGNSTDKTVTIPSGATLEGIAQAINSAGIGVQATILDTGTGLNRYKLVLSGSETGTDNDFTVSGDSGALQTLATEINGQKAQTATNAEITINNITVQRSTNVISDAIEGVTLDLNATAENDPPLQSDITKLTINADATATAEKVKKFVDAYNEIVDFMTAQNTVSDEGEAESALFGDFTLRSVQSQLRSIMGSVVDNGNADDAAYSMMSLVGITAETSGRLTFNQTTFEDAVTKDSQAVRDLFTYTNGGTDQGIALRVNTAIGNFTDAVDGLITSRQRAFDDQIRRTDDQIRDRERRLELFEEQQRARFAALESLIGQLQSQGSALSSFQFPTAGN